MNMFNFFIIWIIIWILNLCPLSTVSCLFIRILKVLVLHKHDRSIVPVCFRFTKISGERLKKKKEQRDQESTAAFRKVGTKWRHLVDRRKLESKMVELQEKQVYRSDPLEGLEMGGPRYLRKDGLENRRLAWSLYKEASHLPTTAAGQLPQCQAGQKTGGLLSGGAGRWAVHMVNAQEAIMISRELSRSFHSGSSNPGCNSLTRKWEESSLGQRRGEGWWIHRTHRHRCEDQPFSRHHWS